MAQSKHSAYGTAITVNSGTEINSLANNTNGTVSGTNTGTLIDNATDKNLLFGAELILGSFTPTSGGLVYLYGCCAPDGTNYSDALVPGAVQLAVWQMDGSASAKRRFAQDVSLEPGKWKTFVRNECGATFPASGCSVKLYPHNVETL